MNTSQLQRAIATLAGNLLCLLLLLGSPLAQAADLKVYYLHTDHLDTPRLMTDEQNRVVWKNGPLAEPFGLELPNEDPDGDGVHLTLNLRFPGQYFDKESGLHYNYYRDYDPLTGRYMQSDPIGLAGGINTYAYVGGNSLNFIDPNGLQTVILPGGSGLFPEGGMLIPPGLGQLTTLCIRSLMTAAGPVVLYLTPADISKCQDLSYATDNTQECKFGPDDKKCPPCKTQSGKVVLTGTIGYRFDKVPPGKPHYPYTGDHYNLYKANQNPNNCQCFWQEVGAADGSNNAPPPQGAIPIEPFVR